MLKTCVAVDEKMTVLLFLAYTHMAHQRKILSLHELLNLKSVIICNYVFGF